MNPHQVTKDFERAIGEYTGAPYVVAVNSCTMAILLALAWRFRNLPMVVNGKKLKVEIPKRTYVSVPMSIIHAGGWPIFKEREWSGFYELRPFNVWDCARWFSGNIYPTGHTLQTPHYFPEHAMICVSFHASKTLGIEQGGAILHDDPEADKWLRAARFDGRTEGVAPKDDKFTQIGWHCYMNPSTAAQGLLKMHSLKDKNAPLPNDDYPDLSKMEIFNE